MNKEKRNTMCLRNIRLGKVALNKRGRQMKIIRYGNNNDIDVQFEDDGTIVEHARYSSFKNGALDNFSNRLNEERINNAGLKMKIVEYTSSIDIKVQFEDGTIVNSRYTHFLQGKVRNPNEHVNKEFKLKDGRTAKVVKYYSCSDVDVKLSTGELLGNISIKALNRGSLGRNPKIKEQVDNKE